MKLKKSTRPQEKCETFGFEDLERDEIKTYRFEC